MNQTSNFKATALSDETLRTRAPSIYASGPMMGVSHRYAFVPTAEILTGLRDLHWVPVEVEEQRIRQEARRGFQKHLIRLRLEAQTSGASTWAVLWGQLTNSAGALICVPLRAWYAPGTAILRPFQAALFVMGLILLLRDRKDCRFSLLMLWAGVFTAVGALSESTPAAQRYVAAAPLCALMAAYGLSGSFSLAERLWPERRRQF